MRLALLSIAGITALASSASAIAQSATTAQPPTEALLWLNSGGTAFIWWQARDTLKRLRGVELNLANLLGGLKRQGFSFRDDSDESGT